MRWSYRSLRFPGHSKPPPVSRWPPPHGRPILLHLDWRQRWAPHQKAGQSKPSGRTHFGRAGATQRFREGLPRFRRRNHLQIQSPLIRLKSVAVNAARPFPGRLFGRGLGRRYTSRTTPYSVRFCYPAAEETAPNRTRPKQALAHQNNQPYATIILPRTRLQSFYRAGSGDATAHKRHRYRVPFRAESWRRHRSAPEFLKKRAADSMKGASRAALPLDYKGSDSLLPSAGRPTPPTPQPARSGH